MWYFFNLIELLNRGLVYRIFEVKKLACLTFSGTPCNFKGNLDAKYVQWEYSKTDIGLFGKLSFRDPIYLSNRIHELYWKLFIKIIFEPSLFKKTNRSLYIPKASL